MSLGLSGLFLIFSSIFRSKGRPKRAGEGQKKFFIYIGIIDNAYMLPIELWLSQVDTLQAC